jgi:hypothetical protein
MADIKTTTSQGHSSGFEKEDIANVERVMSSENEKDFMNYDRVDAEVAKCNVNHMAFRTTLTWSRCYWDRYCGLTRGE